MPGRVITVDRKTTRSGKLGWAARSYLPAITRALLVTSRHFFANLRGFVTGRNRRDFVVQYPEERVDYPDAFRGMPVLVAREDGTARCVACGLCEFACPTKCIEIDPAEEPGAPAGRERIAARFDIDMSRCMFCGLCEEACPEEAIVMSREVELATFTRAAMLFHKEELLVPEASLERRLRFLRGEYDQEYAPPIAPSAPSKVAAATTGTASQAAAPPAESSEA